MTEITMDDVVHALILAAALGCCVAYWRGEPEENTNNQIQKVDSTQYVQNTDTIKAIQMNQQDTRQR